LRCIEAELMSGSGDGVGRLSSAGSDRSSQLGDPGRSTWRDDSGAISNGFVLDGGWCY
jgi:hypothetical protein